MKLIRVGGGGGVAVLINNFRPTALLTGARPGGGH